MEAVDFQLNGIQRAGLEICKDCRTAAEGLALAVSIVVSAGHGEKCFFRVGIDENRQLIPGAVDQNAVDGL